MKVENSVLKKETVKTASKIFLTANQEDKNKIIDRMFKEHPSLSDFLNYLDKSVNNEFTKEVIIQLISIFYIGFSLQKIELKQVPFDDLMESLNQAQEIKKYFSDSKYEFDNEVFKILYNGYTQKEMLNYTHFAINNQFRDYIKTEGEAMFIFYLLKIIGDAFNKNIIISRH